MKIYTEIISFVSWILFVGFIICFNLGHLEYSFLMLGVCIYMKTCCIEHKLDLKPDKDVK